MELADQAKPAVDAVCKKQRRDDMDSQSPDNYRSCETVFE